ncbi:hypothetical protein QQ045_024431 [Rhodiola kirilowii]
MCSASFTESKWTQSPSRGPTSGFMRGSLGGGPSISVTLWCFVYVKTKLTHEVLKEVLCFLTEKSLGGRGHVDVVLSEINFYSSEESNIFVADGMFIPAGGEAMTVIEVDL